MTIEPRDEWNEALIRNVHPEAWQNPVASGKYDLVAIGAGTAGLVSAAGAAGLGAKVALIERAHLGGDCLNVGCVPSKALLRSAHVAAEMRDAGRFGVRVPAGVEVDFAEVMRRMREVRAGISPVDSVDRFTNELGVDVFLGDARFTGDREIEVGGQTLRFKKAVVATGGRAVVPPIDGLADAGFLTNETIFNLTELPGRLLVVGGGPIGCELSQAFRRFGAEVTVVEQGPQFLSREDPDAAEILRQALVHDGIDIRLETRLSKVVSYDTGGDTGGGTRGGASEKIVTLESNGHSDTLAVDSILVAAGRAPNVEGMGLEAAGIEFDDRRGVVVDDHLRTTNRKVFAAGDVCMRTQFTHAADFAARTVIQNALFFGRKKLSTLQIPWCTYTSPEIAHVGLYERDATAQGIEVDTYMREFSDVDRAITEGDTSGFVKIHTQKGRDKIVGATIVARHAGDLISEVSVAMQAGMGLGRLASVIHPYPTQAEAIRQTGDAYNRTRVTAVVRRLFDFLLKLNR
jgi:pyruvate/2-oxoglutarate dehydrogenase complex dihydrolipoamide dehydrogenase (E3) component